MFEILVGVILGEKMKKDKINLKGKKGVRGVKIGKFGGRSNL